MSTLTDAFQRRIRYLRLSVTDRCDLRCNYCMPQGFSDFQTPSHWLTFDEIERIARCFVELGVHGIRLTGGEPLLRKNLTDLVKRLTAIEGLSDLSLSTNATRLTKLAKPLQQAGLNRINVSLDTLKPEKFKDITKGKLDKTLSGLQAAKDAGLQNIKINMVVMRNVNDDEIESMLSFCIENDFTLRYIETMPMGSTGQQASEQYLSLQTVKQRLMQHYELVQEIHQGDQVGRDQAGLGPARYMQIAGTNAKVGFITPISEHFCEQCNRVRLSVEGSLYPCLGQNDAVSLRDQLRNGADQAQLKQAINQTIAQKPERHEFTEKPEQVLRFMSVTGG